LARGERNLRKTAAAARIYIGAVNTVHTIIL